MSTTATTAPPLADLRRTLLKTLGQRRRVMQLGLVLHALLRVAGWAACALVVLTVADFWLALPSEVLLGVDLTILAALAVVFVRLGLKALAFSNRDMAQEADHLLGHRRRPILNALELQAAADGPPGGLESFLIERSVQAGCDQLALTAGRCFPFLLVRRQLKVLTAQTAVALIWFGVGFSANQVILSRIFFPTRDVPPWTRYVFHVTPSQPSVLYGGTIEMTVEITGQPIRSPVNLLTRKGGRVDRSACFQESATRFAQRLEKVIEPVEFCFATGRARSRWQPLAVLLQPQISLARIEIAPPAYSGLPKREFIVGNEPVASLVGSRATLTLTSNRPLSSGALAIKPDNGRGGNEAVRSEKHALHTLTFSWTMKEDARLEVIIRDIQGTPAAEPLAIVQKIVPDTPPEVAITEPAGAFALATAGTRVPLIGTADDDLGLKEISIVRTMVGYRDRSRRVGPQAPQKSHQFNGCLDLSSLGVTEGDVIEVYLEARDFNPSLMGIGSSEIVRIEIISNDDYAELLRNKITLEEFQARYQLIESRFSALKEALRQLRVQLEQPNHDPARTAGQLKRASELAGETAKLFRQLSDEFAAFDMEKRLGPMLKALAAATIKASHQLANQRAEDPMAAGNIERMLRDLGENSRDMEQQVADAADVVAVGKVMRHAATFKQLLKRQQELARKLKRFESELRPNLDALAPLASQQDEIRNQLVEMAKGLASDAAALPAKDDYAELKQSAGQFSQQIGELQIAETMNEAVVAGRNQDGRKAAQRAALAMEKMESLVGKPNDCFAGLCQNGLRFKVNFDLAKTMRQMLAALLCRSGQGIGQGQGEGAGAGGDGYSASGYSPLNTPVFGPARSVLTAAQAAGGAGPARGSRAVIDAGSRERMPSPSKQELAGDRLSPDRVPEKYREAVKRYFEK